MKKAMKKLMAALLAVAMVCAMAIPAFAAEGGTTAGTGSITIEKAVAGETYTIYKMFNLDSFDTKAETYSYTVVSAWEDFFKDGATGNSYITLENGHPTWVGLKDAETYKQFAKAALAYATENHITATRTAKANSNTVKFDNLDLGYYLVDTSLGALCGLDTTKPNVTIIEKNQVPDIKKEVTNSEGNWADSNTAKIGDTVNYKVTITVQTANNRYVLHDTMSEGLTFNKNSVKVTVGTEEVAATNYEVVTAGIGKETLNVRFKDEYIATLDAGTEIVVTYSAVVNEKAKVDSDENKNEAHLVYGNKHEAESTHSETKTYLYQFDLVKYCGTSGKLLGGAQFKLYDAETNGNVIPLVKITDGIYRVATANENPVDYIETVAGKTVKISGLDKKVYYLQETVPPAGYNGLTQRVKVDLSTGSKTVTPGYLTNGTDSTYDKANASSIGGVAVENNAGTTLPSTGGIGTTLFYVIGGGLMAAAAILLITKKRMENH
ncbi:MAG: SpaH/EbpB family LPXTG-anchored major pilin [Faecalibacterium prausnitzii]|nr:SpaH/EbpB family LPXTG-anchored major pilin [Faecalibacterium prausnitzii]